MRKSHLLYSFIRYRYLFKMKIINHVSPLLSLSLIFPRRNTHRQIVVHSLCRADKFHANVTLLAVEYYLLYVEFIEKCKMGDGRPTTTLALASPDELMILSERHFTFFEVK